MAYSKTTWVDDSTPYLSAANLNKIESGIHSNGVLYDTLALLKAETDPPNFATTIGRVSKTGGGGGNYYFILGDSTSADDFLVIADDAGTGRYFLLPANDGSYSAKQGGAYGDDSTDMHAIMTTIDAACAAAGAWLNIPKDSGAYVFDSQLLVTCNVTGTATIKTTTKIGNGREGVFKFNGVDLTVERLDFDCNSLSAAVSFGPGTDDCVVDYITSKDAYRAHITKISGTGVAVTYRGEVKNCVVIDAGKVDTEYGDSMYFTGAIDFDVHHNTCDGFTRIGIVFEADDDNTRYSESPKIHHNNCINGMSVDNSVLTAGIWCENTNGSDVNHNTIDNVGAVVAYNSNGISNGGLRAGDPPSGIVKRHNVLHNTINNVYVGIRNPSYAVGNRITNFKTGIYFTSAFQRGMFRKQFVRDTYFGYSTFDYDGADSSSSKYPNCFWLINAASNGDIEIDGVEIEGITKDAGETELADLFFDTDPNTAIGPLTTISFDATDNSINDSAASFGSFSEGDTIVASGSASNSKRMIIKSSTSSKAIITADTTIVTEAVGPSVTITPYETLGKLTIKNVKHLEPDEKGLVIRSEAYTRCKHARFENCPIHYTLGMRPRFWDKLEYVDCPISRTSPVDITTRADVIKYIRCSGSIGGRIHATDAAGTVNLFVIDCDELVDGTLTAYNNMIAHIHRNILDGFTLEFLQTNASYVVKAIANGNTLINNSGGYLLHSVSGAADVFVLNSNTKDDATAIYTDTGSSATVTNNGTSTI